MMNKNNIIHIIKLLIGAALFIWVFYSLEVINLFKIFISADAFLLFLAMSVAFSLIVAQAMRQYSLLVGIKIGIYKVIKVQYVATFVGNFLPATLGIDIYKSLVFKKHTNSLLDSSKIVFIDRLTGLFIITILGLFCLIEMPITVGEILPFPFNEYYSTFIISLIVLLIFSGGITYKLLSQKWQFINEVSLSLFTVNSLLVYGIQLLKFYLLFVAIDADIGLTIIAQMLLVVQFASLIPLSVGGLGIVEGSIVGTLIMLGVSADDAAFIAMSNRITILFVSALGYYYWIKFNKELTV